MAVALKTARSAALVDEEESKHPRIVSPWPTAVVDDERNSQSHTWLSGIRAAKLWPAPVGVEQQPWLSLLPGLILCLLVD